MKPISNRGTQNTKSLKYIFMAMLSSYYFTCLSPVIFSSNMA